MREIRGIHVLIGFVMAFSVIITVNVILAVNAVRTFPGLEVKNSYIASQSFEGNRVAQEALDWTVSAHLSGEDLILVMLEDGAPVQPVIEEAIFGRPTSVAQDQRPEFSFVDGKFIAKVFAEEGNWNLRLKARAADGTLFSQRIIVES